MRFDSFNNRGSRQMKTHVALFTALATGVIAIGSVASRADDDGGGKVVISSPHAPPAIGPYSQAIRVGRTVYVSGEVGADSTGTIVGPSIGEQTDQALTNIGTILGAAGLTLDNVVATTVYLVNVTDFAEMNAHYATFFKNAPPSRATIQVAALPKKGALVEISAVAVASE
jgi:2-iminobutanoate/2-iminopropanoate deaminase